MRCIHHGVVSNVTLRRVLLTAGIGSTQAIDSGAAASRAIRNGSGRISDVMYEDIDIEEVAFPLHCRTSPITVRAANGRTLVWKAVPRSRSPTSPLRTSGGRAGPGRGEVRLRDGGAVLGGRAPLHEHCHRKHNHSAVTTQSAHRYSTVTAQGHRTQTQRRNSTHAHLRTGTASTPARPRGCLCARRRRRRRVGG